MNGMKPEFMSVDALVDAMNALKFDTQAMHDFRDMTIRRLIANPKNRAARNEAILLVEMPYQRPITGGTPCPIATGIRNYNGGGPEDDISFERAIKRYEDGE